MQLLTNNNQKIDKSFSTTTNFSIIRDALLNHTFLRTINSVTNTNHLFKSAQIGKCIQNQKWNIQFIVDFK